MTGTFLASILIHCFSGFEDTWFSRHAASSRGGLRFPGQTCCYDVRQSGINARRVCNPEKRNVTSECSLFRLLDFNRALCAVSDSDLLKHDHEPGSNPVERIDHQVLFRSVVEKNVQ